MDEYDWTFSVLNGFGENVEVTVIASTREEAERKALEEIDRQDIEFEKIKREHFRKHATKFMTLMRRAKD